ncbi:unnamed protein product [Phytophthora fragariaefolia]|uniref:Unnamed protein product n=1 Tax=Phytophthora fragariaefolia TaxID=1490495 RepID=A0A9W7CYL6_9STRA|nr:unnamed protein product [Phytophthora fragariaefolia]
MDMGDLVDSVAEDLENANGEYPLTSRGKAVLALSNSLVRTAASISGQLAISTRQLNAETNSPGATPGSQRSPNVQKIALLKDNKTLYESRFQHVLKLVNSVFTGVVVHRYRDVMPDIRVVTMQCLGHWIISLPDQFLKDNFLKYLGWLLSDKSASVRLEVIKILCELYENDAFTEKLELFTSRFLPRYLELCNDVDDAVVEECIHLLIAVDKRSLISSDIELQAVEKLVFDEEHEDIRKAAAEFVCLQYDAFGVAVSKTKDTKLKKEQLNTQAIALVEFAEEYIKNHGIPEGAVETLVDAFWGLDDCPDSDKLELLLKLIPMLTLKSEVIGHHSSQIKELLEKLKHAYLLHSDEALLQSLSLSITHLIQTEHASLKREAEVIVHELLQQVVEKIERLLEADEKLYDNLALSGNDTTSRRKTKGRKKKNAKTKEISDVEYGLRIGLCRLKCLIRCLNIREYLPPDLISSAGADGQLAGTDLKQGKMDILIEAVGNLLRRRSKSVSDLDQAFRNVDTIKHSLIIIYSDLLWTTSPIFKAVEEDKRHVDSVGTTNVVSTVETDSAVLLQIQRVCQTRSTLEEAFISVLEMHLTRAKETSDEEHKKNDDTHDAHLIESMEEIEFEDEGVISYVKEAQRFAFLTFCDVRCLFVEKFQDATAPYDALEWSLPKVLVLLTQMHFESAMDDAEDEEPELEDKTVNSVSVISQEKTNAIREWEEKQQRKAELLVALGRVSLCNPSKKHQAAAVLQYFTSSGKPSVEVVKAFGKHVKTDAPVRYLEIQMTALRQLFNAILIWKQDLEANVTSEIDEDEASEQDELRQKVENSEQELRELAKRFSQSLGVGKVPSSLRAPFLRFLREGVRYSLEQQTQFVFLETMRVYLSHLDNSSMAQLREYFMERLQTVSNIPNENEDLGPQWRAVFDFQASVAATGAMRSSTGLMFSPPLRSKRRSASSEPTPMQGTSIAEEDENESEVGSHSVAEESEDAGSRNGNSDKTDNVRQVDHNNRQGSPQRKRAGSDENSSVAGSLPDRKRPRRHQRRAKDTELSGGENVVDERARQKARRVIKKY